MRAVAPRAAIARFATHRSAILRAQFLMRPVDMDKVVAFGGSQRVLGKCCIWLTRMQAMRMRLNQRWFDSRAVQATLALCVALLPEPSPEQLRYCFRCCSILALCAVLLALVLLALLLALRLKLRWFDSRAVQATLALCVALLPELTPEQLRHCWSVLFDSRAVRCAPRARALRAAARAATQTSIVALLLAPRSLGMRTAGDLLAV